MTSNTDGRFVRINGGLLQSHIGEKVTLLGQFMSLDKSGRMLKMKLTDDVVIMVSFEAPVTQPLEEDQWLNVTGTIDNRNRMRGLLYFPFSKEQCENFDTALYNEMIAMTFEHKEHFTITENEYEVHFGTNDPGPNGDNIQPIKIDLGTGGDDEQAMGEMNFDITDNSFGGEFADGAGF